MRGDRARRDKLVKALVDGLTNEQAAAASGYGRQSVSRLRNNAKFATQVDKAREERVWGGSADLAPVINELVILARKAATGDSPAALNTARAYLVEIARLKLLLGEQSAMANAKAAKAERKAELDAWAASQSPK